MSSKNNPNKRRFNHHSHSFYTSFRLASVLLTLAFSTFLSLSAKQVTARQALNIARKYITPDRRSTVVPQTRNNRQPAIKPFYVFNDARGKGFVVVSGDDAMGEVLAYSDTGALDTTVANPGVKLLLQAYRKCFAHLQQFPAASKAVTRTSRTYKIVAPLLSCKWNQTYPYNKNTGYTYTGCVATAMAQMMYYHQWPAQGKGKSTYTVVSDNQMKHADFSKSHYDWAHMKDIYDYHHPSTDIEKEAVALLMSDIGIATKMQYTAYASGTYDQEAERAFQNNFDYTTAFVTRSDEGTADFTEIVRQELLNGFPVYLSGYYSLGSNGHAWVTDGQDERGLFHMNFGWGGQSNGYFSLTATDVAQSGGEFGGRPLSFRVGLIAILAHPNKTDIKAIDPSLLADSPKLKFNLEGSLTLPEGSAKTFNVADMPAVEMTYFINKGKGFKGDIGVGIFDMEGKLLTPCPSDDYATGGFTQRMYAKYDDGIMKRDYLINVPQKIKVDLSNLSDGYYQLLPICVPKKNDGSWGEWIRMKLAPRMIVEIRNHTVRVAEEDFITAGFQFSEQPSTTHFKPGSEEVAYFSIRNKGGLERTCYAKLQLLDTNDHVSLEIRQQQKTAFTGFDTTLLPFTINIPTSFTEGKYRIKLELIEENDIGIDNPAAERYVVSKVYDKDDTFFDISLLPTGINHATTTHVDVINNGPILTIRGSGLQQVKLFDLNGRLLNSTPIVGQSEITLSLAGLAQGVYVVQITDNGRTHTRRFLKQ